MGLRALFSKTLTLGQAIYYRATNSKTPLILSVRLDVGNELSHNNGNSTKRPWPHARFARNYLA